MKHNFLIRLVCTILSIIVIFSAFLTVSAVSSEETPYQTYTYWQGVKQNGRKAVYCHTMFEVNRVLTAQSLNVTAFKQLNDVCVDENKNIYLLDDSGRIAILNSEFNKLSEIGEIEKNEEKISYSGAKSLYVANNLIYICDTENARVLITDNKGKYVDEYLLPDSPLIPEKYEFRPLHAVMDERGYFYVLSDGSYYGMILYDENKEFLGFYGANEVTTGIIGVFKNVWNRMFVSNTKKSNSARKLPYVFSDVITDKNGFVYTATGFTDRTNRKGQIKKFSPGTGRNILESGEVNFTDDEINITYNDGEEFNQNIIGLDVDEEGYIYCLDSAFGRIYMYDKECTMVSSFGSGMGNGVLRGTFVTPSAIAVCGSDIIVTDSTKNTVTVFSPNEFALTFKKAQTATIKGDYLQAKDDWQKVISQDKNCQFAYKGLARAFLTEGDYKTSMKYAKEGYDRKTYGLAFELYRQEWIGNHFQLLFFLVIFLVAGIIAVNIYIKRKNIVLIKNKEVKLLLSAFFHPSKVFSEIEEKKCGKLSLCVIMVAIYYVTTILQSLSGGFLFTYYDAETFNSLLVLIRSAGLVILWIVCNWMICTLTGGRGKIKDIAVATCYCLMPLIINNVLQIILTNFLLPSEAEFLSILHAVAIIYTFIMLAIAIIKIHDFTFSQFVGTGVLTIISMAAVVFLIIMIILLIQQLYGFIASVVVEMFL